MSVHIKAALAGVHFRQKSELGQAGPKKAPGIGVSAPTPGV